jgi:hypothetical protein
MSLCSIISSTLFRLCRRGDLSAAGRGSAPAHVADAGAAERSAGRDKTLIVLRLMRRSAAGTAGPVCPGPGRPVFGRSIIFVGISVVRVRMIA